MISSDFERSVDAGLPFRRSIRIVWAGAVVRVGEPKFTGPQSLAKLAESMTLGDRRDVTAKKVSNLSLNQGT
jgi:hypothetical protein